MSNERVFVTGVGVLSALGTGFDGFAAALREGRCGAAPIKAFDTGGVAGKLGCEVRDFDPAEHFGRRELRRMDRCSQFALAAARQAVAAAGIDTGKLDPARAGVSLGTTLGGMVNATRYYERLARTGHPYAGMLTDYPLYSPGARIVGEYGFCGPNLAFSTACSSSNIAIGHAADLVRYGRLDLALAGGVDTMAKITVAGFNALRNVTRDAIRPFDKNRSGLVLGEGAAVLCLESERAMRRRGASPLAEILGYGMSTDAYHMTAPDATGRGPALAMTRALARARLAPDAIGHINAHGTGTRHNDETETRAIKSVFGAAARQIPVSSTKSMHGHVLGATGAIEAAALIAALRGGFLPPTINYQTPDPRCDLDYVPNQAREHRFAAALSNNFGFGGNNCSLILGAA
jgi:3-oxoacyl-[acyl-carrier-protein] synthase II